MLERPAGRRICRRSASRQISEFVAAATATSGETLTAAGIAVICLLVAGLVASTRSPRVGASLAIAALANGAMVAGGVRLEANHPLRIIGPVVPMFAAYLEMLGPNSRPAYSIARLVFSLSFAAEFAPLFFELWGEWPLPIASILVCAIIVLHAVAPKGIVKWLPC